MTLGHSIREWLPGGATCLERRSRDNKHSLGLAGGGGGLLIYSLTLWSLTCSETYFFHLKKEIVLITKDLLNILFKTFNLAHVASQY